MNTTAEPSAPLLGTIALIACGQREGKTRSCRSCARKARTLLDIATTGSPGTLAAAICGPTSSGCRECQEKAVAIIAEAGTCA
ncbi:hypothetical protein ACIQCR_31645 [Streptomyces sp. NPDC093249]|uniref:hypothetical protein n=1 Tax=unclassified Streptomyces TaxID=2593676 RepID=UPI00344D6B7D